MGEGDCIFSIILNNKFRMKQKIILLLLIIPFYSSGQRVIISNASKYTKFDNYLNSFLKDLETIPNSKNISAKEKLNNLKKIAVTNEIQLFKKENIIYTSIHIYANQKDKKISSYLLDFSSTNTQNGFLISGLISLENIINLETLSSIDKIVSPRKLHSNSLGSHVSIEADKVWKGNIENNTELITGKNTLVGIIELGTLNETHEMFLDDQGNSRIELILDTRNNNTNTIPLSDLNHANHVTGIACGSTTSRATGIAKDAGILFATVDNSNSMINAIKEMVAYAKDQEKPLVINMSLGYPGSPHDGSEPIEQYINSVLSQNPNVSIVVAAGNEGNNKGSHFGKIVSQTTKDVEIKFEIEDNIPLNRPSINIYFDGELDLQIGEPDEIFNRLEYDYDWMSFDFFDILNQKKKFSDFDFNSDDFIEVIAESNVNNTGLNKITISFSSINNTYQTGTHRLLLTPNSLARPSRIDAYHTIVGRNNSNAHFLNGEVGQSLFSPGCSQEAITVSSYEYEENNSISCFSSYGPLRLDGDNPSKPDIGGPGSKNSTKVLGTCYNPWNFNSATTQGIISASSEGNKGYYETQGTSMAAPNVAGAIALILQSFPKISNNEIKTLIKKSADKIPNGESYDKKIRWGSGKLNILNAYQQLIGYDGTDIEKPIVAFQTTFQIFKEEAGLPIDTVQNFDNSIHRFQTLTNGALFQNGNTQEVFWIGQEIWDQWECIGSVSSQIGLPIGNQEIVNAGLFNNKSVNFENCSLVYNGSLQRVIVNENCNIRISENCIENLVADLSQSNLRQNGNNIDVENIEIINTGNEKVLIKVPIHFYLSKDESADEADYFIHEVILSKLKAGEKENLNFTINLSSVDIPPGEYFLGFKIDPKNELIESEEGDNQGAWITPKIVIATDDFSCNNAIRINCGNIYSGTTRGGKYGSELYEGINWEETGPEKIHVLQIDTPGDIVASITTLDENNNITADHDLDIFILSACDPSNVIAFDDKNAILKNATPGTYYIVVDGYNGDQGKYELLVTCGNDLPNLTIDNTSSQIVVTQSTLAFSLNIKNTSCSVPAAANKVKVVLSPDLDFIDNLNPNEDKIIIDQEISTLEPEGIFQIQEQFNLSDFDISPGIYYLGISIDYTKQVLESEERDNSLFWETPENRVVTVKGGAPNIELLISDSEVYVEGSRVAYAGELVNIENVGSDNFFMGFYLSKENPHLRGNYDDYFLGEVNVPGIGPTDRISFNFLADAKNPVLGIPDGYYYLSWVVDYKNEINETDEPGAYFWSTGITEDRVVVSNSADCNETILLTEEDGLFTDNSLGSNYENNTYCQWLIKPVKPTENIYLQFSTIDLGSGDFIEIFNGSSEESTLIKKLSSSSTPQEIIGSNNSMLVRFSSNSSSPGNGFEASYYTESTGFCNSRTVFTKPSGLINDGSGCENYNHNNDCTWIISPIEHDKNISLEFTEFDLAENDFVRIYNGVSIKEANLIATFTGIDLPERSLSDSDKMLIRFTSDDLDSRQGFEAIYNLVETEKDNSIPSLEDFSLGSNLNIESLSFSLTFSKDEEYEVAITNILGQEFYRESFFGRGSVKTIDIDNLVNGYYFLYVYNKQGINSRKFLVTK